MPVDTEKLNNKAFMRIPRGLRGALFYAVQWTWGLPQNLLGLIIFLLLGRQERRRYHGAIATLFGQKALLPQNGAFSLGMFLFIPLSWGEEMIEKTLVHEYGHSIQSMILGPLYLPAVALPSVVWAQIWPASLNRARKALNRAGSVATAQRLSHGELDRLNRRANLRYTSRYPENWANALGEYATGEKPLEN